MTESRIPPRFVPTLTQVIEAGPSLPEADDVERSTHSASVMALDPGERLVEAETARLEDRLLHRVMARIDPLLDARLNDAVANAVEAQLDVMVPRLRRDMQAVLRTLISDALASEIAENPGSTLP
jgi:hypothetical protein